MLTGKQFKLERATLALAMAEGRRQTLSIPVGAIIKVVSAPTSGERLRMVDVLWDGKTVEMFAVDVQARGVEFRPHGNKAGKRATA